MTSMAPMARSDRPKPGLTGPGAEARAAQLRAANINPRTGLATDYLNHFNEAIMLLEMVPDMPECAEDFLTWRPLSYAEHFWASNFKARDLAIVIVSHYLDQVFRLADRICVLRRGRQIGVRDSRAVTRNEIVSLITGLAN